MGACSLVLFVEISLSPNMVLKLLLFLESLSDIVRWIIRGDAAYSIRGTPRQVARARTAREGSLQTTRWLLERQEF